MWSTVILICELDKLFSFRISAFTSKIKDSVGLLLQTKPPSHSSYRWSAILEHWKHPTKLLIAPKFQQLFCMALGICFLGISLSHLLYSHAAKHLSHRHCTIASKKAHLPFFLQLLLAPKFQQLFDAILALESGILGYVWDSIKLPWLLTYSRKLQNIDSLFL